MAENKKNVRYVNQIIKAKITPQQKGYCLEESKTATYGYIKVLIKYFEKYPTADLVEAKIKLKYMKENGIDLWKD
jgi:hypothetical protein|tara:strand:+ start:119 stop:343 length:225 start_codon:yes stop_codon:yes gene_type:complete